MLNKILSSLLACFILGQVYSQGLTIGQKMPKVRSKTVMNHHDSSVSLEDYKGKLLILDFWSTNCLGCLEALPEIDKLQNQFQGKVQFVMVTYESLKHTQEFFQKHRNLRLPKSVPVICEDSLLNVLFPHQGNPYHVWINPEGNVQYKFRSFRTSDWRIQEFLDGKRPYIVPDAAITTYVNSFIDKKFNVTAKYYSYITSWSPEYKLEARNKIPGYVQITYKGGSAVELYKWAFYQDYIKIGFDRPGRLVVRLKEPYKYVRPKGSERGYAEWRSNYQYNYHLLWPEGRKDELFDIMKEDVSRYFPISARLDTNCTDAWVLIRKGNSDNLWTKGGTKIENFYASDIRSIKFDSIRILRNVPFSVFAEKLETIIEFGFKIPFVDSTKISRNIDFEMTGYDLDHLTIPILNQALNQVGLDLVRRKCAIPALIIEDKKMVPLKN